MFRFLEDEQLKVFLGCMSQPKGLTLSSTLRASLRASKFVYECLFKCATSIKELFIQFSTPQASFGAFKLMF